MDNYYTQYYISLKAENSSGNNNETVTQGQVIAVNTGSNGNSQTNASLYRGN